MRQFDFLKKALEKLSHDEREALRLRYIDKLPSKEVAKRLGRSDGATRVLLTRSKQKLMQIGINVKSIGSDPDVSESSDISGQN